jgi:uncharacterized protein YndB with AHSA1/START domain
MTDTAITTQVHRTYIKATPQAIWDAITQPEWTERYGYASRVEYDLRPGGVYRGFANEGMKQFGAPDIVVEGEVIEADAPHKLVQTWRMLFEPQMASEALTHLTYEIEESDGYSKLTVTHDLEGAPATAPAVSGDAVEAGGGWPFILSDLKTLLETGKTLGS